jgi:type IV secretion system protein VirB3
MQRQPLGYSVKLHQALVMPILIGGTPRRFAILNGTIGAAFVLGMHLLYLLPLFVGLHMIAVFMTKKDPYFFEVILRHMRKKTYYDT